MTTEVERLLPLVDQFLKAKPEGVADDDWHDAAIYAVIAGRITDKTTPWVFAESWVNKAKSTFVDVVLHMRGKASG